MSDFAIATRKKYRYESGKGFVSTEDLWDLPLIHLNTIAKGINRQLKASAEEDFLEVKSDEETELKAKLNIVLHIMDVKKKEQKDSADAVLKKAQKEKVLAVLAKKQDAALESLSEEELKAMLKDS